MKQTEEREREKRVRQEHKKREGEEGPRADTHLPALISSMSRAYFFASIIHSCGPDPHPSTSSRASSSSVSHSDTRSSATSAEASATCMGCTGLARGRVRGTVSTMRSSAEFLLMRSSAGFHTAGSDARKVRRCGERARAAGSVSGAPKLSASASALARAAACSGCAAADAADGGVDGREPGSERERVREGSDRRNAMVTDVCI